MAPWELHERYPSLDIKNAPGYPNHYSPYWLDDCLKFDGDHSLAISHIVKFLKQISKVNVVHEDVLMRLCTYSIKSQRDWIIYAYTPTSISSIANLFKEFLKCLGPRIQKYEITFQDLVIDLQEDLFELVEDSFEEDIGFFEQLIGDFYEMDFLLNICIERKK